MFCTFFGGFSLGGIDKKKEKGKEIEKLDP